MSGNSPVLVKDKMQADFHADPQADPMTSEWHLDFWSRVLESDWASHSLNWFYFPMLASGDRARVLVLDDRFGYRTIEGSPVKTALIG